MPPVEETTQIASIVPVTLADQVRALAESNERSVAAEVRLALKAWVTEQAA